MVRIEKKDENTNEIRFADPEQVAWGETYVPIDEPYKAPCRCFGGEDVCDNCCRDRA